ncbi:MAG TPA: heparan-alpha-glucosaminide N-acetyltransferase domain-containing protein [Cyclobacteriaceae bacterium]|nr:heparan-alpha-glucosaminide N-acetyltransferase domain-containing protein [Cyclobacteriaceae bacterium]
MTLSQQRYLSLDVFRGMDVALMIVVNSLGSSETYSPLNHADWHGFTLTDLVFPTFLFVVGNAMSFSQRKYEVLGEGAFFIKILKRTAIIFLIGYLMYWFPFVHATDAGWEMKPFSHTRVFGVLQRIALCYFIASVVIHYLKVQGALVFCLIALITYRLLLAAFGDLSLEGNAGTFLDLWLLGPNHMYHGEGVAFEPEGLLSTLPSTVNVIAGYVTGLYIQRNGQNYETIAKMLMTGVVLVLLAIWWDLLFPINKKLWTSSYVLLTVGIDLCVLSVLIFIIDIAGQKKWTYFFEVFGRNTLFIYLLSEVFVILMWAIPVGDQSLYRWIYHNLFQSWAGNMNGSPLFAIWVMLSCWVVGYLMDKRKIYVKV